MKSILTKNQKKTETKFLSDGSVIRIEIRYDDECGNGHNSFAITGEMYSKREWGKKEPSICGCIHEEIKQHFPEYAHLIKWHGVSSKEPMHYIANSLYFAGNRDCHGLLKGEKKILSYAYYLEVNKSPFHYKLDTELKKFIDTTGKNKEAWKQIQIEAIEHKKDNYNWQPKYCFKGMDIQEWHKCPFDTEDEAKIFIDAMVNHNIAVIENPDMIRIGEGKERELESFKSSACWYDATIETISQDAEVLKKQLEDRLENLILEFKKDIEALGFIF